MPAVPSLNRALRVKHAESEDDAQSLRNGHDLMTHGRQTLCNWYRLSRYAILLSDAIARRQTQSHDILPKNPAQENNASFMAPKQRVL